MASKARERRTPLRITEAAAYLGLTERWVRRAIYEKRIPYYKPANVVLLDPDELDAWLESHKVDARAKRTRRRRAS